ncbi:MAG: transcriptional repressor LexA [Anaerovoracaceae bacterium]|nr:transcriptional repressor LexA [Anaerovoracaceae bacterium]
MTKSAEREKKILDFMKKEVRVKGYPPTVREICTALGIKSTSTVHKDISNLVNQGFLKKDPSKPRALMVVQMEDDLTKNSVDISNSSDEQSNMSSEEVIDIPVVGRIAAGTPITAIENIDDSIPVPARFLNGESYMLRVVGESMINVGIMDGDLILVEKTSDARNGEIVVAMVDGFESEATVKTFYKEDGHIRLQPENDTMSPIIVNDVTILGKVKGVFRYFS